MVLDESKRILVTKNKIIELSFYEYKFIYYLIKNKNRNCTYKELIMYIYDIDEQNYKMFRTTFRTLIKKMRKKIEKENLKITTINNYGLFIIYIVDDETKKRIKKYENQIKIDQLKQEISKLEEQIKLLEKETI